MDMDPLYNAPTLILVSAGEMPAPYIEYANAGCIMENMMLKATELGLGSVIIWGSGIAANMNPAIRPMIKLDDNFKAVAGIVVGHSAMKTEPKELAVTIKTMRI